MPDTVDFVVKSPDDEIQLLVEAKSRSDATALWASHFRRNLIAHSAMQTAPYFILALPDRLYLWKDATSAGTVTPDYTVDTGAVLQPYLSSIKSPLRDLTEQSFELVIRSWLEDLVKKNIKPDPQSPGQRWLIDSGLYDRVKDGKVKTNP